MSMIVQEVNVWAGDLMNRPEKLARVLEALASAGAELEFLVARRVSETTSRVFVAPLRNERQQLAAMDVGLVPATGMHAIRIDSPDRQGLGAEITRAVAAAGINIRGATAATIGGRNVFWLAFRTADEMNAAQAAIQARFMAKPSAAKGRVKDSKKATVAKRPVAKRGKTAAKKSAAARPLKKDGKKKPGPRRKK